MLLKPISIARIEIPKQVRDDENEANLSCHAELVSASGIKTPYD
jgi:hypothetical protein